MIAHSPPPVVVRALLVFLAVMVAQRIGELLLSARNSHALRARGAREFGSRHYPLLILVHTVFPLLLAAEVLLLRAQPGPLWPLWLSLWLAAQALRYAAVRTLGSRWSTRILVLPHEPLVTTGPYRFLRHPNYVAVATELLAAPLLFGAWRTALTVTVLNALALRIRISTEARALRGEM